MKIYILKFRKITTGIFFMLVVVTFFTSQGCNRLIFGLKTPKPRTAAEIQHFYQKNGIAADDVRLHQASFYNFYHPGDSVFGLDREFRFIAENNTVRLPGLKANHIVIYDSLGRWLNRSTGAICTDERHHTLALYLEDASLVQVDTLEPKIGTLKELNTYFVPLVPEANTDISPACAYVIIFDAGYMPRFTKKQIKYFNEFSSQYPGKIHVMHYNLDIRPGLEEEVRRLMGKKE